MNEDYADQCIYDAVAFYAADETATDEMISAKAQELFEMERPEYVSRFNRSLHARTFWHDNCLSNYYATCRVTPAQPYTLIAYRYAISVYKRLDICGIPL